MIAGRVMARLVRSVKSVKIYYPYAHTHVANPKVTFQGNFDLYGDIGFSLISPIPPIPTSDTSVC